MAFKPKTQKERILHRLKIARGHMDKVIQMVEEDTYCVDVMHQMQAVESGLKETGNVILENHLNTCVTDAIKRGEKDTVIKEVMEVFKKAR